MHKNTIFTSNNFFSELEIQSAVPTHSGARYYPCTVKFREQIFISPLKMKNCLTKLKQQQQQKEKKIKIKPIFSYKLKNCCHVLAVY